MAGSVRRHHQSDVKLEALNGEHSRAILIDFGSPQSAKLLRPAECAEALEPQDSSFQFSSITSNTVAPEGVAGLTTPAAHHRPPPRFHASKLKPSS